MSRAPAQLPLGVGLRDDATFVNYHPGPNASLVNRLAHQLDAEGEPFLYLWGAEGVGRSHLLQAACDAAGHPLTLRLQPGYDHSYYFIASFIEDHLRYHAERLHRKR